jgi:hypothetical protein
MGQPAVTLTCANPACGKLFTKPRGEFNRSERLGRQHFCSLKCSAQLNGIKNFKGRLNTDTSYLRDIIRRDEYSPFRYCWKFIKKSVKHRNKESSVTLLDLKQVWERQQGICPYTGWELVLLPCTTSYLGMPLTPNRASVDRRDSSKGYTPDNIQFVAIIANFAKNAFPEEQLIEFCYAVTGFWGQGHKSYRPLGDAGECNINTFPQLIAEPARQVNRRDEYSPFRQHLKLARRRVKGKDRQCTITLQYLKELWEKQGGRCPYTGWELDNPETTKDWDNRPLHPRRASLDRIDSSLGYVPVNVQFVSVIANFAKCDFPEDVLLQFCKAVVDSSVR